MPMSGSISPFTDCQVVLACIRVQQLEQVLTRSDEAFRVMMMMMMMMMMLDMKMKINPINNNNNNKKNNQNHDH